MIMIPPERLVRTILYSIVVVECDREHIPVPRQLLASLGGLVGWLSQVNPVLVPFTHRAADLAFSGRSLTLAHVDEDVVAGLAFMLGRAREGTLAGVTLLPDMADVGCDDGRGERGPRALPHPDRLDLLSDVASRAARNGHCAHRDARGFGDDRALRSPAEGVLRRARHG
jgi:hypothetical protein